jgi:hypothetical protein
MNSLQAVAADQWRCAPFSGKRRVTFWILLVSFFVRRGAERQLCIIQKPCDSKHLATQVATAEMQHEGNASTLATVSKLLDSLSSGDVADVALYLQRMDDTEVCMFALLLLTQVSVCTTHTVAAAPAYTGCKLKLVLC